MSIGEICWPKSEEANEPNQQFNACTSHRIWSWLQDAFSICSLRQIITKDTENDHDQLKLSQDKEVASLELLSKNIVNYTYL